MAEPSFYDERSDRETVARLTLAIEQAYTKTGTLVWRAFLQGFVSALGAAIATVLLVLIAAYLFNALGGPALLQNFISSVSNTIVHTQEQALLQALPLK